MRRRTWIALLIVVVIVAAGAIAMKVAADARQRELSKVCGCL